MKFWRTFSDFRQSRSGFFFERGVLGFVGCNIEDVEIIELIGCLCPQRLQRADCVGPTIAEEIAQSQQITSLKRVGRLPHYGFEWLNRPNEIILAEIDQPDVRAGASNIGCRSEER